MKRRILVVEDDAQLTNLLRLLLEPEYVVEVAARGHQAVEAFRERPADLVLLDLMLPDLSGIAVGQAIRDFSRVPILVLSARSEPDNKVLMLRSSADDYVTKPFHSAELLARIEALLRRSAGSGGPGAVLSCGDLTLDRQQRCIRRRGQELHLSPLEFRLLAHFMEHPDRVLLMWLAVLVGP